jgi:hypothetical protein
MKYKTPFFKGRSKESNGRRQRTDHSGQEAAGNWQPICWRSTSPVCQLSVAESQFTLHRQFVEIAKIVEKSLKRFNPNNG